MKVKCTSCGAIAEPKESENCIFCGSSIQEVAQVKKIASAKSDLTLAQIQFRDNDYDACIHTFNRLKKSGITKINEDIYEDLYIALKKEILPNERYYSSCFFDPEFQITYDKLFDFLNYQNTDFKNKIVNVLIDVYSWNQNMTIDIIETDTGDQWLLGYRRNMLGEIKRLIIEFEKWDIDKALISRAIITIKELYSATINYYWKEAEQAYNDYIADKGPFNEYD